jgi:hypothetical protein
VDRTSIDPLNVVGRWDRSLRTADWEEARAMLADDASYEAAGDEATSCRNADQIVAFMRTWKGKLPDVEVVVWEPIGSSVLAQLRQPAWGEDADWFQVLTVEEGLIRKLEDRNDREAALAAIGSPAP